MIHYSVCLSCFLRRRHEAVVRSHAFGPWLLNHLPLCKHSRGVAITMCSLWRTSRSIQAVAVYVSKLKSEKGWEQWRGNQCFWYWKPDHPTAENNPQPNVSDWGDPSSRWECKVIAMLADATLRVESHDRRSQLCIHQEDFQPLSCVSVSQVLLELEVEFAERMQFKHTIYVAGVVTTPFLEQISVAPQSTEPVNQGPLHLNDQIPPCTPIKVIFAARLETRPNTKLELSRQVVQLLKWSMRVATRSTVKNELSSIGGGVVGPPVCYPNKIL